MYSHACGQPTLVMTAILSVSSRSMDGVSVLQGRGGSTGYDNAVALPARSDSEELAKENNKSTKPLKGQIVFSVAKVCFRPYILLH